MKNFHKETKTIKGINGFLATIGLNGFGLDADMVKNGYRVDYFDFDGWLDSDNANGASVTFYRNNDSYEVFVTKYTTKDIADMEAEFIE